MNLPTYQELFPEGRELFYEGDDSAAFAAEMREKFLFDPGSTAGHWHDCCGGRFLCPPEHLDELCSSYPVGT